MASNRTITQSLIIDIQGKADSAVSALKQVESQMKQLSSNGQIFAGVDKEFSKLNNMMDQFKAKFGQGIETPKEFNTMQKDYTKIIEQMTLINNGLEKIRQNSDGAFQFKAVDEQTKKIEEAKKSLDGYTQGLKEAQQQLKQNLSGLGFDDKRAKSLSTEITSEQQLIQLLADEWKARQSNVAELEKQVQKEREIEAARISGRDFVGGKSVQVVGAPHGHKGDQTATANDIITVQLKQALTSGQSLEQTMAEIRKQLQQSGIELNGWNSLATKIESAFNDVEKAVGRASSKLQDATTFRNLLGSENRQFTPGAIDTVKGFSANAMPNLQNIEETNKKIVQLEQEVERLKKELDLVGKTENGFGDVNKKIDETKEKAKQAGEQMRKQFSIQQDLKDAGNYMTMWIKRTISLTGAWRQFTKIIRQTFTDVQKLDKAFASIAMVTDKTVSGLWNTYSQYSEIANKLGQTTESAIKASALFYQQGLDTAEALKLTEDTMKLATLAGSDFETATKQMTAALRGFHMEMDQGAHVTDVYSELAAHAAADVNGIAYAMSKTASIANNAGMSFETTAAFLTNMIETTQEAPENIGTAMKTIIARFTELKENVAETADSEFDDLSYNKVDEALKSVGISLKDAQGQFRNLDDVFLELSAKWDTLDRNTQRYIATTAAGSRQQSRFIAMMEDYDRTMELVSISQDSAGRSSKQFAKYQETVEYKLNQLKNSWEQFRTSLVNSDAFKKIIDGLNKVVGLANKIGPKVVVPIIALIGVIAKIIGSKIIDMATQLGTQFAESFVSGVKSKAPEAQQSGDELGQDVNKGAKKETDAIGQTGVQYATSLIQGVKSKEMDVKAAGQKMKEDLSGSKKVWGAAGANIAYAFTSAFTNAFTADNPAEAAKRTLISLVPILLTQLIPAIVATGTAAEAAEAAATAGISLLIAAIAVGVSALVNYLAKADLVGSAWEKTDKKIKQAAEDAKKTAEELSDVAETSKEAADNGKKLKDRYTELSKKVVKTEEEQEEYNNLIKEINETFPQIVSYYDEVTGELRIQDQLWDSILAKQERQARMDRNAAIASEQVASDLESEAQRRQIMKDTADSWGIGAASVESIINGGRLSASAVLKNSDIHKLAEAISNATNIEINELIDANGEATEKLENTLADQIEDSTSALRKELEGNKDLIAQISKADVLRSNRSAIEMYENNTGRELTNGEKWLFESMQGYADRLNYENKKVGLTGALNAGADIQQKLIRMGNQKGTFLGTAAGVSDTILSAITGQALLTLSQNTENELFSQKGVNSMALNAAQRKNFSFFKAQKNLTFGDMQGEFANQMAQAFGVSGTNQITFSAFAEAAEKAFGEEVSEKYKEAIENNTFDEFIADVVAFKRIENQSETIKAIIDELQNSPELLEQYNNLFNAMQQDGSTAAEISAYTSFMENNFKEKYGETFDLSELIGTTQAKYEDALKAAREIYGNLEQDWSDTQLSVINTFAADLAASNAGETNGYAFANSFVHSAEEEGFNQNEISAMIQSVDWDNISLVNYESEKEKFIETMKIAMGDAFDQDKVDRMWEYFFGEAEKYNVVNLEITTEGQLQSVSDSVEAQMESYYEAFSGITGYISNQVENGFIDPLDKGKIKEAYKDLDLDMDDYFGTDAEGNITFLYEKLAEDTREQISNQDKLIQKAKDEYQAGIEKLEQDNATYETIVAQLKAQGELTAEILNSAEAEAKLQQIAGKNVDYGLINEIKTMAQASDSNKDLINELEKRISANKELITQGRELLENEEYWKNQVADSTAYLNGQNRLLNEAIKTGKEAAKSAQDDSNKIVEAQKKVIEAQKKLNEAMYGTEYHKNKVDPMYNYNNMLKEIQKQIDTTKKKMDKLADSDASDSLESYRKLLEQESSVYQAERKVYEQSIANYQKQLTSGISQKIAALNSKYSANMNTDISSYYRTNPITGMLDIDFAKLNAAHLPDDISDMIESVIDEINKGNDKIREIDESMEKRQEELEDFEKKVLDGYVKVEDEVIKVLKDKYKEEIDANKEKNDAMADADKEYLDALQDAIEKQRKLRDQENKWNDLAKKERQASLMARDTSGVNRVELNKLNEEINKDRQDLLDETVDNILDNLKDMYDLQKEQRDKQIELQEQELDEQKLIKEATSIISSWTSPEDVTAWMIENNKEVADMSDAKLEQQIQDWENLYHSKNLYENYSGSALDAALQGDTELINQTFVETSEAQIAEADRMTNEVIQKTDDSIESAKNSLESAIKSLNEELNKQTEYLDQIADNTSSNSGVSEGKQGAFSSYQEAANALVSNKGKVNGRGGEIINRGNGTYDIAGKGKVYGVQKPKDQKQNESEILNKITDYKMTVGKQLLNDGTVKLYSSKEDLMKDKKIYKYGLYSPLNKDGENQYYGFNNMDDMRTYLAYLKQYYNLEGGKTRIPIMTSTGKPVGNSFYQYASGGLVRHTGPAWVDGTPQKPEAFLSAKDTARIGMLTTLLSSLPFFNSTPSDSLSQNIGDTSIEVNINIESISSEVDMDNAIERMKTEIVNAARPQGSTVILRK